MFEDQYQCIGGYGAGNREFARQVGAAVGVASSAAEIGFGLASSSVGIGVGLVAHGTDNLQANVRQLAGNENARTGLSTAVANVTNSPEAGEVANVYAGIILGGLSARSSLRTAAQSEAAILANGEAKVAAGGTPLAPSAAELHQKIGPISGKPSAVVEQQLVDSGFIPVSAKSGGKVYTQSAADGNTASVRVDPANPRAKPGFADAKPHYHKEIVPSEKVTNGNYENGSHVTKLDDAGKASTNPR